MKLSVIIPFYNELSLLNRSVASALSQLSNISETEILICNDGPFEEIQILEAVEKKFHDRIFIYKNINEKGPGGARNTGLESATGDLIGFLDADDFWLPGKLELQLTAINNGATFVVTAYKFDVKEIIVHPPVSIHKPLDIFQKRGLGTSTVMISKELLEKNRFKDLRFAQDIDFWYRLAFSDKFRYHQIDKVLVSYRSSGTTKNKLTQLRYMNQILRLNKINKLPMLFILASYITSGIFNHYIKNWISNK